MDGGRGRSGPGTGGAGPGEWGQGRPAFVRTAAGGRLTRLGSGPAVKSHGKIYDSTVEGDEGLSPPVGPGRGCPDSPIVPSAPPLAGGRGQPRHPGRRSACLLRGASRCSAFALFPPLPGKQRSPLAPGPAPGRCRAGNQEAACPICHAFDS